MLKLVDQLSNFIMKLLAFICLCPVIGFSFAFQAVNFMVIYWLVLIHPILNGLLYLIHCKYFRFVWFEDCYLLKSNVDEPKEMIHQLFDLKKGKWYFDSNFVWFDFLGRRYMPAFIGNYIRSRRIILKKVLVRAKQMAKWITFCISSAAFLSFLLIFLWEHIYKLCIYNFVPFSFMTIFPLSLKFYSGF